MTKSKIIFVFIFAILDFIYTVILIYTENTCFAKNGNNYGYCGIEKYIIFLINVVISQFVYFCFLFNAFSY
jgi:hypothetical protein